MVNRAIPEEFRDHGRAMTRSETDKVLGEIARKYPERYREVSHALMGLGRNASFDEGTTLRLSDTISPVDISKILKGVQIQERRIKRDRTLSTQERQDSLEVLYGETQRDIQSRTMDAAVASQNPLALQVTSKARGNPSQLAALLTSPGVYQDAKDRSIPMFIQHSYAHGLDPHEYFAAAYGARKGVVSTKHSTARGGYLGKLLASAVMDSVVTDKDCGTPYGIPVAADDHDNVGAVLARPAAGFEAGTVIDHSVLAKLQAKKVDKIVVRSPISCGLSKGVCQICAGQRESGDFPEIGYHIGLNSSSAFAEQVAQQALSVKHCLTGSTAVLYADWTSRPIKDVKVGDMVMGCGVDGKMRPVRVLNVFDNGSRECHRTTFIQNGCHHETAAKYILESTLDHKLRATRHVSSQLDATFNYQPRVLPVGTRSRHFYALPPSAFDDTGCTGVKDQKVSELVSRYCGTGSACVRGLRRIKQEFIGIMPTYDIQVDHPDHLFVLANGLVVSNSGRKEKGKTQYSGFDVIKNLSTIPSTFPNAATVSEVGGQVQSVTEAPQGGYNVMIGDQEHYVAQGLDVLVKPGETVEPGDQLSDGILNPSDVVRLKGIGEGRRYFATRLTQAMRETNLGANRRNAEVLARSIINHVQINDPDAAGHHLPGDVVQYQNWSESYRPRPTAQRMPVKKSVGRYLEEPSLHYTIGTPVTKRVSDTLHENGVTDILTHQDPVGVDPTMISVIRTPEYTDDWMARLSSSYLKTRLLEDVHAGATSNPHGLHPAPGMAMGTEFGQPKGKKFTY